MEASELVTKARSFVSNDINKATAEWIHNSTFANKYTGRIQIQRDDILQWVDMMDKCGAIITELADAVQYKGDTG